MVKTFHNNLYEKRIKIDSKLIKKRIKMAKKIKNIEICLIFCKKMATIYIVED